MHIQMSPEERRIISRKPRYFRIMFGFMVLCALFQFVFGTNVQGYMESDSDSNATRR
jgi:hypothetical protein